MVITRLTTTHALLIAMIGVSLAAWAPHIAAQAGANVCAPVAIPGHYGPFDYVTERPQLEIVDRFHFTPKVEALIGGESGYLGGDLSYTLNAAPNHHRALLSLMRYGAKLNSPQPPSVKYSIECYFDRATRFRPKDTVVRSLYAMYLAKQLKRMPDAMRQLEAATAAAGENALSHYNIGLVYLELGQPEQALRQAHRAQKLGYTRPDLADRLKQANQWKDPAE